MIVRAKFKVDQISRHLSSRSKLIVTADGKSNWESYPIELCTIILSPVYSSDPNNENHAFWEATPSGKIELGVVNAEAVKDFDLGNEYYIDFTPVVTPVSG